MTKMHVALANATTMTLKDLLVYMGENQMGQVIIPMERVFIHIVMIHDAEESDKLREVLNTAVEASIVAANTNYFREHPEAQCESMSSLGRCIKSKGHKGFHRNDAMGAWSDKKQH